MVYTTIRISKEIHDKIKTISIVTGVKQKDFVDQAINNEIRNYQKIVKKLEEQQHKQMRL
ncbi:MAG: hypothetical protein ACOCP8_01100 [archaeon]